MDPEVPFEPTPDRLSEFTRAFMTADPVGAATAVRKATEVPLTDLPMAGFAVAMVLYAIAAVLKQIRPVAQPFAEAAAERIRDAPEAREKPLPPAKTS